MYPIIYHMADIHISNNTTRYEEYSKVFENVYKQLESDPREKLIVICGDLYDNKTVINTTTLKFVSMFISKLIKYGDIILINGNHDVSMQNEATESTIESMLTLSAEMNIKGIEKIHFLNENKIYKIKGINFGLTTMFTDEVTKIENKIKDEVYVGLYHGKVIGAKTDIGFKLNKSNSNFSIHDFKDYDLVLLGDIHKHQYLDKNKRIAYPSSLVQKDYGETIKNHGLIIWNPNDLSSEFMEIKNEYCMLKCKYDNKILNIDEDINLNDYKYIKAKIEYKSKDVLLINSLEKQLKKQYNFKEITMYQEIELTETKTDDYKEVKINDNIYKVLEEYINKTTNNEEIKKKMKVQINQIIKENELNKERTIKKINFKYLLFGNLFCYGKDNKINFEKLNKINGIIAENGYGKSSIIDVILYTIYKKCSRASGTKVLNKFKKNAYSVLLVDINDNTYIISRKIIPDGVNKVREEVNFIKVCDNINFDYNTLNLLTIDTLINEEKDRLLNKNNEIKTYKQKLMIINGKDKKETDKIIADIFGSYDELTDNNILLQNGNNFLNKSDKEKKEVMYKIFGITEIDNLYQIIHNKLNSIKKEITNKSDKIYDVKLLEEHENMLLNLDDDLIILKEQFDSLNDEINLQEYYVKKLNELSGNQTDYEIINNELEKYKKEYQLIIKEIDELNNKLNINLKNEDDINIIFEDINQLKTNCELLHKKIISFESKKNNINYIKNINDKKEQLEKNNLLIEKYKKEIEILTEKIINNNDLTQDLVNIKKLFNEYNTSKQLLIELTEENKYLLEHKFSDSCLSCKHNKKIHKKINYIEKIEKLNNFINENNNIEEKLNNVEEMIDNKNKIKELKEKILNYEKENNNINELLKINNKNLEQEEINKKLDIEINKTKVEYEKYNLQYNTNLKYFNVLKDSINKKNILESKIENYEKIKLNWKKNEEDILILKDLIIDLNLNKNKKIELEKKVYETSKKIVIKEQELIENEKKVKDLYEKIVEREDIKKLEHLFTQDNLIENLLNQIINNLEGIINNVLKDLTNFSLKFEISPEGILIYKVFNDEYIDARYLSGYEMFSANISMRIAFSKLNKFVKTNFIIIDEGFSSCSSTNIHKISSVFEIIKQYYKWCIAVSHIDIIKSNFDYIYNIKRIEGDSLIKI